MIDLNNVPNKPPPSKPPKTPPPPTKPKGKGRPMSNYRSRYVAIRAA